VCMSAAQVQKYRGPPRSRACQHKEAHGSQAHCQICHVSLTTYVLLSVPPGLEEMTSP
jgi:hypothetical protein